MRTEIFYSTAILIGLTMSGQAQQTVAPSPEISGPSGGTQAGNYAVSNSFELGYRFRTVGGNQDRYRSDINFGNGIRLLSGSVRATSRDGHGKWFDEFVLNTQGIGHDPYQSVSLRLRRNRFYRYDGSWRRNEYVNPGLANGTLGGHTLDTRRDWQDHDVTLFPNSAFQFFAGYSRNWQTGPGIVSLQAFDNRGDEYPLFASIDRKQTEIRLGTQIRAKGFQFSILRGWQKYREDSPSALTGTSPGANPADNNTLTALKRSEPIQGDSPFWRFVIYKEQQQRYSVSARYSYSGGRRSVLYDETFAGTNRFGAAQNRQILLTGSGRRPLSSGTMTLAVSPTGSLTITNHTAFHDLRMDGDGSYREFSNASLLQTHFDFQTLNFRTIANATDVSIRANKWLGVYGGYSFSSRKSKSVEGLAFGTSPASVRTVTQQNRLNIAQGGLRINSSQGVSIVIDAEVGRANNPYFTISDRNYHAFGGRVQYRHSGFTVGGATKTNYNLNSNALTSFSSKSRNYSLDASWQRGKSFGLDAAYSKIHLDTLSGIAYFAGPLVTGEKSYYVSNIHALDATARVSIEPRADLFFGYSRIQDTGDGRATPGTTAFQAAQTFPLSYESPQARLSLRIRENLRWNVGYQYYRYREDFTTLLGNYRAHTGFSSVLWSF